MSSPHFSMQRAVDAEYRDQVRDSAERFRDGRGHEQLTLAQAVRANRKVWSQYTTSTVDEITYAVYGVRRK